MDYKFVTWCVLLNSYFYIIVFLHIVFFIQKILPRRDLNLKKTFFGNILWKMVQNKNQLLLLFKKNKNKMLNGFLFGLGYSNCN